MIMLCGMRDDLFMHFSSPSSAIKLSSQHILVWIESGGRSMAWYGGHGGIYVRAGDYLYGLVVIGAVRVSSTLGLRTGWDVDWYPANHWCTMVAWLGLQCWSDDITMPRHDSVRYRKCPHHILLTSSPCVIIITICWLQSRWRCKNKNAIPIETVSAYEQCTGPWHNHGCLPA